MPPIVRIISRIAFRLMSLCIKSSGILLSLYLGSHFKCTLLSGCKFEFVSVNDNPVSNSVKINAWSGAQQILQIVFLNNRIHRNNFKCLALLEYIVWNTYIIHDCATSSWNGCKTVIY